MSKNKKRKLKDLTANAANERRRPEPSRPETAAVTAEEPRKKSGLFAAKGRVDGTLILTVIVLIVFGLVMLYSASSYNSQLKFGTSTWYVMRQLRATAIGFVLMIIVAFIPVGFWRKVSWLMYVAGIVVTMLVLSPLGIESFGARRWLDLKFISMQPAEVVKIAVVVTLAAFICKFYKQLVNWQVYAIAFLIDAIAAGMIVVITSDMGTGMIIFAIGFVMLILTDTKLKYLLYTVLGLGVLGTIFIVIEPYRLVRVKSWLNVEAYADDESFQIMQALYAIGSGGLFGKGLGKSTQKGFVPEPQNDMIFSIICEELGVVGGLVLIGLFVLLLWRFKKIYDQTQDRFGRLIVAGIGAHIGSQTLINMMVVTSLIPNTGVPLPFISYGGSAIMMLLVEIGMVLAVCRTCERVPEANIPVIREDKQRGVIYYQ